MVQMAMQLRMESVSKEEILKRVIKEKLQNLEILDGYEMCSKDQVLPQNQKKAFSRLLSTANMNNDGGNLTEEDAKTGYGLFQAIVYCPTMVIKLFRFVHHLLSTESQRTIIQTFVNLFQSGALTDKTSFTLAKQLYFEVVSALNLQFGDVLLPVSTKAELQAILRNDWPFLVNNTGPVEKCLQDSQCDIFQNIFNKYGMHFS